MLSAFGETEIEILGAGTVTDMFVIALSVPEVPVIVRL